MTYFDAAAARHATRRAALIVLALAAPILGGCETAGSLFGSTTPEALQANAAAAPAASAGAASGTAATAPAAAVSAPRVALAPIMGAPDNVSKQLGDRIVEAAERQKVVVSRDKAAAAEYTLRGYVVAAKDPAGTKLSYIWDVTDKVGTKRHHRIQGEDVIKSGAAGSDPWAAVDARAIQALADKASAGLAKWLPSAPAQAAAQPAVASAAGRPAVTPAVASQQTTASIGSRGGPITAVVLPLKGAPGDGNAALAAALRNALKSQGVTVTDKPGAGAYTVRGTVSVGQSAGGSQDVTLEWSIATPDGKPFADAIVQRNKVPSGSLDGRWGDTAKLAAEGAAPQVTELLRNPKVKAN